MADFEELQQKEIELDLSNVPADKRTQVKEEVGQYVLDEILSRVGSGESPVSGERFKQLTKKYADKMKGGNRTPNLELEGDMLASLGYRRTSNGVAVGIMEKSQRPKADGHNNFSGQSSLPKRRFIPAPDQNFKTDIESGIQDIVSSYEETQQDLVPSDQLNAEITSRDNQSVTIGNLFNTESLASIILRRLSGR